MQLSTKLKRAKLHKSLDTYLDAADKVNAATRFEINDAITAFRKQEAELIKLFAEYVKVK